MGDDIYVGHSTIVIAGVEGHPLMQELHNTCICETVFWHI